MGRGSVMKRAMARIRQPLTLALGEPFAVPAEKNLYRQFIATPAAYAGQPPLMFHPACLAGRAIRCRPETRDWSSLQDLLFHQFYLPPAVLRQPRVIVDLGCNVGYTAAHLAALYPTARIFGLELDSDNFAMALKNTDPWRERVTLLNAAIWS
ncbi:MAG: hypothetical protein ABI790_18355, partial [Betaproteobacteria bacterium]